MAPADLRRLLLLGAVWGASFILIRIAAPVVGPIVLVEGRVLIAALCLFLYARARKSRLQLRARWPQYLLIGGLNSALPFALIAATELRLSASMAAILNATSPLFGALFSALWLREPLTGRKVTGIVVAVAGVAIVVGFSPLPLNAPTLLAVGSSLLAATCYGLAGTYTRARVHGAPPLGMAVGSQLAAALLLAPVVPFVLPRAAPPLPVVISVALLGVFSTACAYILFFRLLVNVGPTRTLTVTFLTPVFGMLWGAIFLREAVTPTRVAGCLVILLGAAMVTGLALPQSALPQQRQPRSEERGDT